MRDSSLSATLEFNVPDGGDAIAAYSDVRLDAAVGLRLEHDTGCLTAVLDRGIEEGGHLIPCGAASPALAARLRGRKALLWVRSHGSAVAGDEIELVHL